MGNQLFDRCVSSAFLIIGLLFIIGSFQISTSTYGSNVGPGIFPLGLGMILTMLSISLWYQTFSYKQQSKEKKQKNYKKLILTVVALCFYISLFELLGYVISTFLFLLATFQIMEHSKLIVSVIISALFSLGVYYFYVVILQGSLPPFPQW